MRGTSSQKGFTIGSKLSELFPGSKARWPPVTLLAESHTGDTVTQFFHPSEINVLGESEVQKLFGPGWPLSKSGAD